MNLSRQAHPGDGGIQDGNGFVRRCSATGTNPCDASVAQITTMPPGAPLPGEERALMGEGGGEKQELSFMKPGALTPLSVTQHVCSDDKNVL